MGLVHPYKMVNGNCVLNCIIDKNAKEKFWADSI